MSANHTWAFNQLNQLTPSPGFSPSNGPVQERSELTLSFPCDGTAIQAQLEQWTNVAFDFDSPDFGSDPSPPTPFDDNNKPFHEDPSSSAKIAASRFTPRGGESLFNAVQTPSLPSNALNSSSQLNHEQEISTVDLSALLAPTKAEDFNGSLVDPALALPNFHDASASLPSAFFTSPSAFDSSSLPAAPPTTIFDHEVEEHAPSPSTSTTSSSAKGKKSSAPAAKKKRAPAVEKVKALPLPEGINTDGMTEEELNNLAIEEDKRRRNTAASARFRVKKKQREQALEQTAKELRDRVAALEKDVDTLRTENGWLRSLITDKTVLGGKDGASNNKKRAREDDESNNFSSSVLHV